MTEELLMDIPHQRRSQSQVKEYRFRGTDESVIKMFLRRNCSATPFPMTPQNKFSSQLTELQQEVRKAELQKEIITRRLEAMRSGAVSAIAEKSKHIEKLREKLEEQLPHKDEDHADRMYQCSLRLQQESQNIDKLKQVIELERQSHLAIIAKRNKTICELGEELELSSTSIGMIEQHNTALTFKLRQIEAENEELHDELLRSKSTISVMRESLQGPLGVNTSNNGELGSESQFSEFINRLFTQESRSQKSGEEELPMIQHHHGSRLKKQLEANRLERQNRKRELAERQMEYELLLQEYAVLKAKKSSEYPTSQQLSERSCGSIRLFGSDLRNEIKMLERYECSYQQDLLPQLQRKCASQCTDNESEFSLNHFSYQQKDEESLSVASLKTFKERSRHRLRQKESAPISQLDEISEASLDLQLSKQANEKEPWGYNKWIGLAVGVVASALLVKLAINLCS